MSVATRPEVALTPATMFVPTTVAGSDAMAAHRGVELIVTHRRAATVVLLASVAWKKKESAPGNTVFGETTVIVAKSYTSLH